MYYLPSSLHLLPDDPGIYLFLDEKSSVLYVGKARNIKNRVSSYFSNSTLGTKTKVLVSHIAKIKVISVESEIDALLLEANYIKKYNPKYNLRLTDDKAYPLIKITIKDSYPKVLLSRREDDPKVLYFGPYPSGKALTTVLKIVRKAFPYQSVLNHPKKTCLYYHLGLCPCPPAFDSPHLKKEYRKNIAHIIDFLQGGRKRVIKDLEKERDELSRKEEFEKARLIQEKIQAITYITDKTYSPLAYDINPNLREDLRAQEMDSLVQNLKANGVTIASVEKIECFDISNIQGYHATGSMVVFVNGEKTSSLYRRFKIRIGQGKPNDVAMMEEVLKRRLKHTEWVYPDLIVLDGGKGQITSVLKALSQFSIYIPVIGLAKREEIIITSDFKLIRLPKDSYALNLVRRIRDEAHRFAITYHRKLRSRLIYE